MAWKAMWTRNWYGLWFKLDPQCFVCLVAAFDGNGELNTNAVLQMKDSGIKSYTV